MSPSMEGYGCEGISVRNAGAASSENVGTSNERMVKTHPAVRLRVPPHCQSSEG